MRRWRVRRLRAVLAGVPSAASLDNLRQQGVGRRKVHTRDAEDNIADVGAVYEKNESSIFGITGRVTAKKTHVVDLDGESREG